MRPVAKWPVGQMIPDEPSAISPRYNPYQTANPLLQKNLGPFCSYCEVLSSDLEVEHIISQDQDSTGETLWDNFLLACGRCNGSDNKSNKPVDLSQLYFPHRNNTLLSFEYLEGGFVQVNSSLNSPDQKAKAENTLNLVGIDKYPGNPKYNRNPPPGDKRWEHRRSTWEWAVRKLDEYEAGKISAQHVAEVAFHSRGFFSVWLSVFAMHQDVRRALIDIFPGTAPDCFDHDYNPVYRNPTNTSDPI